jgi:hypothetical protein
MNLKLKVKRMLVVDISALLALRLKQLLASDTKKRMREASWLTEQRVSL